MPRRAAPTLALLAGVLAAGACTCRGRSDGAPPERFLPADVDLALVVPETARAAQELAALQALLARFPGAADLAATRGALAAQLGFDPLDAEALAGAGIDPRRGAALGQWRRGVAGQAQLLVLPVRDRDALAARVARVARERLGAGTQATEDRGGRTLVVFRPAAGSPPALSYAFVDGSMLLAAGASGPDVIAESAARAAGATLRDGAPYETAREALGDRYAALVFAPPRSRRLAGLSPLRDGVAVGTSAGTGGVRFGVAVLLADREPSFRALAAKGRARELVTRLDPAAPAAATWDGDFAALGGKLVPMLPEPARARLAARGLDLQRDLFDVLAPGGAVVLSLAPDLQLAGLSGATFRDDPLRVARFEAVLPVRDPAAATATSERLTRARPPHGRAAAPAEARVFRIGTGSGEITWTVDAERRHVVVAGGPTGGLDALRARLQGGDGFEAPTRAASDALAGGLGGAVIDAQRLVRSVRALPDAAFGEGPTGFVMRSVVERFLEPAARLEAVSLRADLAEGALVLHVDVEARAAGARP